MGKRGPLPRDERIRHLTELLNDTRARLEAAEKRIAEMNEAFSRGYFPSSVQAHS